MAAIGGMDMRVLDGIRDMLTARSSVKMVADDPVKAAQIMLLVRVMFADGNLTGEELALFKGLCKTLFEIPEKDVPDVIHYLRDYGYETSGEQAALDFQDMPVEERRKLLVQLITMARVDKQIHAKEADLITRVGRVLGFSQEQVRAALTRV
ncbi:MAG: TerB family tellurite resistance protein [Pseudomonadota bacterium]